MHLNYEYGNLKKKSNDDNIQSQNIILKLEETIRRRTESIAYKEEGIDTLKAVVNNYKEKISMLEAEKNQWAEMN